MEEVFARKTHEPGYDEAAQRRIGARRARIPESAKCHSGSQPFDYSDARWRRNIPHNLAPRIGPDGNLNGGVGLAIFSFGRNEV